MSVLAPGDCTLCRAPLLRAELHPVCRECIARLETSPLAPGCDLCGEALAFDSERVIRHAGAEVLCDACTSRRPAFARAVAFGSYDDLRPAVHCMKFDGTPALARPLGRMLARTLATLRPTTPAPAAIVPVPLSRGKRSFNQSTLLARHALRCLRATKPGWQISLQPTLLRRIRWTESQFLLTPAQRRENLRGAFQASAKVRGLHILLVDDVYTTGATATECTAALLREGAASVQVATLARAVRQTALPWQPARAGPVNQHVHAAGNSNG